MTGSTYKSFGGPPSRMVFTSSAELAARLDIIAFPGFTANFNLSRAAAIVIPFLDLLTQGREYAKMCIFNAKALAETLHTRGCEVFHISGKGFSNSLHVALPAANYGEGDTIPQSFWKNPIYSPVKLVCHCLLFREALTRYVWGPRKLHVGECTRKIWNRLPTFFATCC